MSLQACPNVTLEDVAVLCECCPSGRDSSLILLVLVFVSGAVSLSQKNGVFNVLDLSIVLVCRFPSSLLSSTCLFSDLDCHFHQLIPEAFVIIHVVYCRI